LNDAFWMRRALTLAAKGFTPPNPMVGCVLVRDGEVVGEGYHLAAGGPHAEAAALGVAGDAAAGATAYVTLEPCSHFGRTPPCADALICAGVTRVVAAAADPNSRVSGRGFERLRNAGIEVSIGLLEQAALRLNEAFFHFHLTGAPFVTIKAAATLDGKIATRTGSSRWVTGDAARRFAHRLRAQAGAVMVGIGTVLADEPELTARLRPSSPRQPLRVIVDSRLRTPPESRAVCTARSRPETLPLLIACTAAADRASELALTGPGVEIVRLAATKEGRVDLAALLQDLARREVISVLVDGGGELNAAFVNARLAQKALFFVAPKIAGGKEAPTAVEGQGVDAMGDAIVLHRTSVRRLAPDYLIEGYFQPQATS
jgi:diaminohydroxyphosphoribosylaminopyrimidine deaminase/5-amino-6-(5-phosphoribosylamino)uracil reductase